MSLLQLEHVDVGYGDYQVLWDISLTVEAGEVVGLLGANGSGKSTLFNAISGLVPPRAGRARFDGVDLFATPTHSRAALGMVHVLERRCVFPDMTVQQNLILGAWHPAARAVRQQSIDNAYALFPRLHERRAQRAKSLSGGEQQMLALARGLMAQPTLMLVDEPFLGLMPQAVKDIKQLFAQLQQRGIAVLFIEQDVSQSLDMADRLYVLDSGGIGLSGPSRSLRADPRLAEILLGA